MKYIQINFCNLIPTDKVYPECKLLKKWANPGLFFVNFRSFFITISMQIEKSIDNVHGIRTWGRRMVGADENMELWQPPT